MPFDFSHLLGKIVANYGTQYNFATAMGLSEHTISLKLNNKVPWKADEIHKAAVLLHIDEEDIGKYFFTQSVH